MKKIVKDALEIVNKVRKERGEKALRCMPRGKAGEEFSCPLANALDHGKVGVGFHLQVPIEQYHAFENAGIEPESGPYKRGKKWYFRFMAPDEFYEFYNWFDEQEEPAAQRLLKK